MPRPKKDDDHKKIPVKFYVLPSYIPIIKNVIKNLDDNNAINYISAVPEKNEQVEDISVMEESEPIKKISFGIDANDWIKRHSDKIVDIEKKESEQKDFTEWQDDDVMIEVDRAVSWGWASCGPEDSQITPDEGFDILQRNGKLATQLVDAKRNGRTAKYNELMTELYERIRK